MQATAIVCADGAVRQTGTTGRVPWWSFTKTVLAVATLRLAERGLIGLDDTLAGRAFSARQLLRHKAGLPDYGGLARYHADVAAGERPWPVDRLLAAVDAGRLRYDPGAGWAYSNIGYVMIARLVEHASGMTLASALHSLVFEPARLESARLAQEPKDLVDVQMADAQHYHPGWVYHGLVVGSAEDAARLLWEIAYGTLLEPTSLAAMKEGRALPDHRSDGHPDPAYGLGLMLAANAPDAHPLGHGGDGPGSRIAVYALAHRAAAVWASLPCEIEPDVRVRQMLAD